MAEVKVILKTAYGLKPQLVVYGTAQQMFKDTFITEKVNWVYLHYKGSLMKKILFLSIIISSLLFSCASADELRSSPTVVTINGSYLSLDAYVWRDFMPPTDSDGDPMRSTVTLNLISGPEIMNEVHLVRQYVVNADEVWAADLYDLSINGSTYSGTSTGGPKWGPDIDVDVVLEFTYDGKTYKILAPDINIDKTE